MRACSPPCGVSVPSGELCFPPISPSGRPRQNLSVDGIMLNTAVCVCVCVCVCV